MKVEESGLKGLYEITLDLYPDERGNFREAWQEAKMVAAGLPKFQPVQQNISESKRGVTRGIHVEPWSKYIHIAYGTVFAAVVDLREDSVDFGKVATFELGPDKALFISPGFGNSYQVTSEWASYSYLVSAHWQAGLVYPAIHLYDADLAIAWPIATPEHILSPKDLTNPTMRQQYPHQYL